MHDSIIFGIFNHTDDFLTVMKTKGTWSTYYTSLPIVQCYCCPFHINSILTLSINQRNIDSPWSTLPCHLWKQVWRYSHILRFSWFFGWINPYSITITESGTSLWLILEQREPSFFISSNVFDIHNSVLHRYSHLLWFILPFHCTLQTIQVNELIAHT